MSFGKTYVSASIKIMAVSYALSLSAPCFTFISGNHFAVDCYSSHRIIINRISLYTIHGRTQVPTRICTIVHGLLQRGSVCNLVRPSPIAKLSDNSVVKEWNSLNQATPSSPISSPSQRNTQGWTDGNGVDNWKMVAKLRHIAFAAQDRSEIHGIIGVQRENWNKLCHMTLNMTTIAAAMLAAMNNGVGTGTIASFGMSMAAFLLNGGAAGFMYLASKFQPSQLAEEQRTASRFYKMLARDIETPLLIDPRLRKAEHLYIDDMMDTLQALDVAFPLPLTPNGLVKFPKVVVPSVLGSTTDLSETEIPSNKMNGWRISNKLQRKSRSQIVKSTWAGPETRSVITRAWQYWLRYLKATRSLELVRVLLAKGFIWQLWHQPAA